MSPINILDPRRAIASLRFRREHRARRALLAAALSAPRQRLWDHLDKAGPVPLNLDPKLPRVHMLFNRESFAEAFVSLRSFFTASETTFPVLVHDDGSFRDSDVDKIQRYFPGAVVLRRDAADVAISALLVKRGWDRLFEFRRQHLLALKLVDILWFSSGRNFIYIDSDVLFFDKPSELLSAMSSSAPEDCYRYNEDMKFSQTWERDAMNNWGQISLPDAPLNAGLHCGFATEELLAFADHMLALPERNWHSEQSVWFAIHARMKAKALSPTYDVCFRHAWKHLDRGTAIQNQSVGNPVVSQHYCFAAGLEYRLRFFHDAESIMGRA